MTALSDNINSETRDIIIELRRRLHRIPEMGNFEYNTAELIEGYLNSIGIETKRLLDTAVIGILKGKMSGKTVALRADMDALPITESTEVKYSSEIPGMMHACGHDVHVASVLGAATVLVKTRERLKGNVIFIFQPDEEGNGGAKRLIDCGVLEDVDVVFGAHVAPDIPEGCIGIRYGKFYAASDMFDVIINGKSAHGASPEKGQNALSTAAKIIVEMEKIPGQIHDKCVISVGMLNAGTARNVIADRAEFSGIIRSLGSENRGRIKNLLRQTVGTVCTQYRTGAEINFTESYTGIVNSSEETAIAEAAAICEFGEKSVILIEEPLMTTEDFGYYINEKAGCFYHIGAGCSEPLHSNCFLPTDEAIMTAVRMHTAVVCRYLGLI